MSGDVLYLFESAHLLPDNCIRLMQTQFVIELLVNGLILRWKFFLFFIFFSRFLFLVREIFSYAL